MIVRYDELVKDPEHTIKEIYSHFGYKISPSFGLVLDQSAMKARHYKSRHSYILEEMGLSRRQISEEFQDIFERFHFDRPSETKPRLVLTQLGKQKGYSISEKTSEGSGFDRIMEGQGS